MTWKILWRSLLCTPLLGYALAKDLEMTFLLGATVMAFLGVILVIDAMLSSPKGLER
jgi:hypothetical protein